MATKNELLDILKEYIIKDDDFYGLCGVILELKNECDISYWEYVDLEELIEDNPPKKEYGNRFYWKCGNKAPRLRWIERMRDNN